MLQKLTKESHTNPFKKPFSLTRVKPGKILDNEATDTAFGPLAIIDHAVMEKGLTIKMHEHINDEILSYVYSGVMHHEDSADFKAPIARGKLMMMNAGKSFWHEEKVDNNQVEMLQIFIRPEKTNLSPEIQFYDKPVDNQNWHLMVGPKESDAPLYVRQQVYILDAHPKAGDELSIPNFSGFTPFLYVMRGEITANNFIVSKQEAITDLTMPLPSISINEDSTLVLFFVDKHAPMSLNGTISGVKSK